MNDKWIGRIGLLPSELLDKVARTHHKRECTVYTGKDIYCIPYKECKVKHKEAIELILVDLCETFKVTMEEVNELLKQR